MGQENISYGILKHMIKLYLTKTDVVRVQSEINQSMEQSKGLT